MSEEEKVETELEDKQTEKEEAAQTTKEEKTPTVTVASKEEQSDNNDSKEKSDVDQNKGMAILAYIIFFIPLLAAKESPFAMYHANQGLTLFLCGVSVYIVGTIIPIIGWLFILPLGSIGLLILAIMGIINAANGHEKPLPLIGKIQLIK
ncbi:DUF4870 domain-containing protein [Oceanobacillus halotolerans]|uniref:DUF4870 domain-containing protein n=1 Tax=Oceanobacillus halotolerans TaxID=2663380 RepID=UPI00299E091E|nr:hypothetical protein [Oceanobacillus halotolerans]